MLATLFGCAGTAQPFVAQPYSPPTPADAAAGRPDGVYSGLSVLTSFHGDCNAGGTGELVLDAGQVTYHDERNPVLSGPLGTGGAIDLASGPTRLTGRVTASQFVGRISGGPCGYDMKFDHRAS